MTAYVNASTQANRCSLPLLINVEAPTLLERCEIEAITERGRAYLEGELEAEELEK